MLSCAFLIAGDCIGAGFIGVPVMTGPAGFWPATLITLITGLYVVAGGLLYLEAIQIHPDGANITSICRRHLGIFGTYLGAITLILMNYYFLGAFINVGARFLEGYSTQIWNYTPSYPLLTFLCATLFGGIILIGTYVTDRVNFILFVGLLATLLITIFGKGVQVKVENLQQESWYLVFFAVPLLLAAFNCQTILPTVFSHYKERRNPKKVRALLLVGLSIPFVVYLAWQWVVIGSTPISWLWRAYEVGIPTREGISLGELFADYYPSKKNMLLIQKSFHLTTFFAAVTSLLVLGIATVDFFADLFRIPVEKRDGRKRIPLFLLTILPPTLISFQFPLLFGNLFNGIIGTCIIVFLGIIPLWLVIQIRYLEKIPTIPLLPGGKGTLWVFGILTFFLFYLEGVALIQ